MTTSINNSVFDYSIQFLGIVLCAFLLGRILLNNIMPKLSSLRWFLAFSTVTTAFMFFMLQVSTLQEYAHVYWICQSISYFLEIAICVQLCKIVIVNNWYITAIFTPVIFTLSVAIFIIYSIPTKLSDVVYTSYAYSIISCFILLIVWLLQGKFEGKLEKPYSDIAGGMAAFIFIRMIISYIILYYNTQHWNITGRLQPINEIVLISVWILLVVFPKKSADNISQST